MYCFARYIKLNHKLRINGGARGRQNGAGGEFAICFYIGKRYIKPNVSRLQHRCPSIGTSITSSTTCNDGVSPERGEQYPVKSITNDDRTHVLRHATCTKSLSSLF